LPLEVAALASPGHQAGGAPHPALFVLASRHLGTARTGTYFSLAPFIGAVLVFVALYVVGRHNNGWCDGT
jgi:hypothetical protein